MLGAIAAEAGGVVLGEVLSRGPTHLAFLAMPPEDAAGGGPPPPKAPDDRGDGEPSDGERPDDCFGPVTG
jgi:hypothetical protein